MRNDLVCLVLEGAFKVAQGKHTLKLTAIPALILLAGCAAPAEFDFDTCEEHIPNRVIEHSVITLSGPGMPAILTITPNEHRNSGGYLRRGLPGAGFGLYPGSTVNAEINGQRWAGEEFIVVDETLKGGAPVRRHAQRLVVTLAGRRAQLGSHQVGRISRCLSLGSNRTGQLGVDRVDRLGGQGSSVTLIEVAPEATRSMPFWKSASGMRWVTIPRGHTPRHQRMIAFCTCSRFSASSKTTECGPSITSLVTSSARCAGRQCMKSASRLRRRHQRRVHLIGPEQRMPALARALRVVHREPGVGDDQIRPRHRPQRIALDLDLHPLAAREGHRLRRRVVGGRPGEDEVEAELPRRVQERGADVVAVARPDHPRAPRSARGAPRRSSRRP